MSQPYVLTIPSELPTEQFLILGRAIVAGEVLSWPVHDAAITVELYLTGQLRGDQTQPAGTLHLSQPLTDDQAAEHFLRLGGEGGHDAPQAALDPTLKAALLNYILTTLLPKLLGRFGL